MLITNVERAANVELESLLDRREPDRLLMCEPTFFEVKDVKNAFMQGKINSVDVIKAGRQWEGLKIIFEQLGYQVEVIEAQPGLEDMVFTANQVLVGENFQQKAYIVPSLMRYPSRQREVAHFRSWFESRGYGVIELPLGNDAQFTFEGHGDAIWHPGKKLLWGGYGHRTDIKAYEQLRRLINVPIIMLSLMHDTFYHLDTAFCALDKATVMIYPAAFTVEGIELIRYFFSNVIEITEQDANNFACNALALGRNVILEHGSKDACAKLRKRGFVPVEVNTSEFMKSGGSVFCLKMQFYSS